MRIIFTVIILIFHFSVFGQKTDEIICDLQIEILSNSLLEDSIIFSVYSNICKISQSFHIQCDQKDTIYCVLDKPSQIPFLNSIYFQKLMVKDKNTNEIIPHIFESNTLKFVPPKDCTIEIDYYYQPDYFYFGNDYIPCVFCPYQQSWFSWYFSIPNMKINSMIVSIPEHLYFFSNLVQKQTEERKIYLSCDSIPDYGISFFWIEKRFYDQIKTNIQDNQYSLYFLKEFTVTDDSTSCSTMLLPAQKVNENLIDIRISTLKKDVKNIEKIFQKNVNVEIIEAYLDFSQDEDMLRWGTAFLLSENQVLIVIDTSFWAGHFCLHEIIHAYNNILPPKNDSSYYFFHESMTEYLAVYFKYNQSTSRDSIYEAKILKYINLKPDYTSIFEIDKNETTLDFGGTYGVIYLKTPFIINSFAKKIGEDKFISILSHFYKQIHETQFVNFQEFEKVFKLNGVSNEEWEWFVKNL